MEHSQRRDHCAITVVLSMSFILPVNPSRLCIDVEFGNGIATVFAKMQGEDR
jgi:hypothetical protein